MFKTTCPKCNSENFGPTLDSVCGGENHTSDCAFYHRGIQTNFNAVRIDEYPPGVFINKDEMLAKFQENNK
jgi:hypothetical protein